MLFSKPTNLAHLPAELLDRIFSELRKQDLLAVASLSRKLNGVALGRYRKLFRPRRSIIPEVFESLPKTWPLSPSQLNHKELWRGLLLDAKHPWDSTLVRVSTHIKDRPVSELERIVRLLSPLVTQERTISSLRIRFDMDTTTLPKPIREKSARLVSDIIVLADTLHCQHLDLDGELPISSTQKSYPLSHIPSITIKSYSLLDSPTLSSTFLHNSRLSRLIICLSATDLRHLSTTHLPRLTHLSLYTCPYVDPIQLSSFLALNALSITHLKVRESCPFDSKHLRVPRLPNLRSLHGDILFVGRVLSIRGNCPKLTKVSLSQGPICNMNDLHETLVKISNRPSVNRLSMDISASQGSIQKQYARCRSVVLPHIETVVTCGSRESSTSTTPPTPEWFARFPSVKHIQVSHPIVDMEKYFREIQISCPKLGSATIRFASAQ